MRELLDQFSEAEVFDELLVIVHEQLVKPPCSPCFDWETILNGLVNRTGRQGWTSFQMQHFERLRSNEPGSHDHGKVVAAVWRLVNRGWACPDFSGGQFRQPRVSGFRLTAHGMHVCLAKPDDSPSRLGFFDRLRAAHAGVDEEVFERLIDATACLDAGLARPAVVMLGIAAEVTTTHAFRVMRTKGLTKAKEPEFKEQLVAVVDGINHVDGLTSEQKHRLHMACVSIEAIRVFRNNAAHQGNPNPESLLVQEQITSACLHLPVVWRELILPNKPAVA